MPVNEIERGITITSTVDMMEKLIVEQPVIDNVEPDNDYTANPVFVTRDGSIYNENPAGLMPAKFTSGKENRRERRARERKMRKYTKK